MKKFGDELHIETLPLNIATFALLIWWEVPENVKLYLIPNASITDEEREVLNLAHNHFVNACDSDHATDVALLKIGDALADTDEYRTNPENGWGMKWKGYRVADEKAIETIITVVYKCGYFM